MKDIVKNIKSSMKNLNKKLKVMNCNKQYTIGTGTVMMTTLYEKDMMILDLRAITGINNQMIVSLI
jgi:hypothetical protein